MGWTQPCENTITSLSEAIDRVDGVEFDLRLTRDGELILHHDRELAVPSERKEGLPRYAEDCSLDEMKELGFDSFADLLLNRDFMHCWLEEAKFACIELKVPHPRSDAGGGWLARRRRTEHLSSAMARAKEMIAEAGVHEMNCVFYSFHEKTAEVNSRTGGDWNAVSLRPVVPPFGSRTIQRALTLPSFIRNPASRLIRRQRMSGGRILLPIAIEYLEGLTRHLPLGRSVAMKGRGLERFNRYRGGEPVVVWQVEERHEGPLLEAGMSPLTDDVNPESFSNGRLSRPTTMVGGTPWHELTSTERASRIRDCHTSFGWSENVDTVISECSENRAPWQSARLLGHRGCGRTDG